MVRFNADAPLVTHNHAPIAALLRQGQYIVRLELTPAARGRGGRTVVFLCKVPWDPNVTRRFAVMRALAEDVQAAFQNSHIDLRADPVARALGTPAVTAHATESGPVLIAHPEWIEKSAIALWGLPKLWDVVRSNGVCNNEYFRPTFVVVLTVALQLLTSGNTDDVPAETTVELPAWQQGTPRAIVGPP